MALRKEGGRTSFPPPPPQCCLRGLSRPPPLGPSGRAGAAGPAAPEPPPPAPTHEDSPPQGISVLPAGLLLPPGLCSAIGGRPRCFVMASFCLRGVFELGQVDKARGAGWERGRGKRCRAAGSGGFVWIGPFSQLPFKGHVRLVLPAACALCSVCVIPVLTNNGDLEHGWVLKATGGPSLRPPHLGNSGF